MLNNDGSQKNDGCTEENKRKLHIWICYQIFVFNYCNGQKDSISSTCRHMQKIFRNACYKQHLHVVVDQFKIKLERVLITFQSLTFLFQLTRNYQKWCFSNSSSRSHVGRASREFRHKACILTGLPFGTIRLAERNNTFLASCELQNRISKGSGLALTSRQLTAFKSVY